MVNRMSKRNKSAVLLAAIMLAAVLLSSCSLFGQGDATSAAPGSNTLPYSDVTTVTPGSSGTTDNTSSPVPGEVTSSPDETTAPTPPESGGDETTAPPVVTYVNPLTGLAETTDRRRVMPISVVLDNLSVAAPQSGISRADILLEVPVEGGITRLIMITNNYGGSEVYGPVRSVRHYTVSLGQAFGTLTVGAGGSPMGYTMVKTLGIPYLDGVNGAYSGLGFYRDKARMEKAGAAHSLMTTGERLIKLASRNGWSTEAQSDVRPVFNFADEDAVFTGSGEAMHVCIPYSASQYVQMIYSRTAGTYYRYQLGDRAHIDAENGEQLNFTNVFLLFAETAAVPDDTEGRLDIVTTGEGSGYYVSGGRYMPIKWSRIGDTSSFVFTDEAGNVISVTPGKTFISVVPKGTESQIELNYKAN